MAGFASRLCAIRAGAHGRYARRGRGGLAVAAAIAVLTAWLATPSPASAQTVRFWPWAMYSNAPAMIADSSGLLEVFAVGDDGAIYRRVEIPATAPTWGPWTALSGPLNLSCVRVARNLDGRLEAFAVSRTFQLMHIWQTTPNGTWSSWTPFSGVPNTQCPFEVIANQDGRLELFGWDPYNSVGGAFHLWQTSAGGGWSAPAAMGKDVAALVAGRNADGRLEVFATTTSGIEHAWQSTPGGAFGAWSALVPPTWNPMWLALGQNADGRLELFFEGPVPSYPYGAVVNHVWQTTPNGGWSAIASLGNSSARGSYGLSVAQNPDGRLEVFVDNVDTHQIDHAWQLSPGGGWSSWFSLGGTPANQFAPTIAVHGQTATAPDPHLALVMMDGTQSELQFNLQTASGWSGWTSLAGNPAVQRPPAPTLRAVAGNATVTLSWNGSGLQVALARATTPGQESAVFAVASTSSYVDSGLPNGTMECYESDAISGMYVSAISNEVCVTPTAPVTTGTMWLSLTYDASRQVYDLAYDPSNPWSVTAGTPAPSGATITGVSFSDAWTDPYGDSITGLDLALDNGSWQIEAEAIVASSSSSSAYNGLPAQGIWAALPIGTFIGSAPPNLPIVVTWRH